MTDHDDIDDEPHGLRMGERKSRGSIHDRAPEPWHFDRRIPIAAAVVMIIQVLSFVWWGAGQAFEIRDHEKRLKGVEDSAKITDNQQNDIRERLARIEEKSTVEMDTLNRIEAYLRRK